VVDWRLATNWSVGGSNPGRGEIFRTHPDRHQGPSSLLFKGHRTCFPRVKRPGRGTDHPPTQLGREWVELHLYLPSVSTFHVTGHLYLYTVGGALDHLEHLKRTEHYPNTICFSRASISVCGLPMKERRQRACAKSRPQRYGGNIRKRHLLSE
jgi:hypothetical protein